MNGVNAETFWTEMDNSDYQHLAPKPPALPAALIPERQLLTGGRGDAGRKRTPRRDAGHEGIIAQIGGNGKGDHLNFLKYT